MDIQNPCLGSPKATFFKSLLLYIFPASETHTHNPSHTLIASTQDFQWILSTLTQARKTSGWETEDCFRMLRGKNQSKWINLSTGPWWYCLSSLFGPTSWGTSGLAHRLLCTYTHGEKHWMKDWASKSKLAVSPSGFGTAGIWFFYCRALSQRNSSSN